MGAGRRERLRAIARQHGLDDAGVAPVALPQFADHLHAWLDAGHAASMAWLTRHREVRLDLRQRFPWAQSALVVKQRYRPAPVAGEGAQGLRRHVSAYARGADYHDIVLPRLEAFAAAAHAEFAPGRELRSHAWVDTGPVLERQLAEAAGLGWRGKNGLLMDARHGSWAFLGVAVSELDLAPTGPLRQGSCGSCNACQPACPTQAFVQPGVLDAGRCISYLTIEHRGPIPRELRPGMGEWAFGCDLCQTACPFNAGHGGPPDPEDGLGELGLPQLLALDEAQFRARFRRTPLWRPRRRGLLRNALVVAGNAGRHDCVPAALALLEDAEPVLREAASWCLAQLRPPGAAGAIRAALGEEPEAWVRDAMAEDLARLGA